MKASVSKKTIFLAQFAMLLAIEAIVCFTPLGSLPIGPMVATLGMVPVIITAIILGTPAGTAMGFFTGLFSFLVMTFTPPTPVAFVFTPFYSIGAVHDHLRQSFGLCAANLRSRSQTGSISRIMYDLRIIRCLLNRLPCELGRNQAKKLLADLFDDISVFARVAYFHNYSEFFSYINADDLLGFPDFHAAVRWKKNKFHKDPWRLFCKKQSSGIKKRSFDDTCNYSLLYTDYDCVPPAKLPALRAGRQDEGYFDRCGYANIHLRRQ